MPMQSCHPISHATIGTHDPARLSSVASIILQREAKENVDLGATDILLAAQNKKETEN